MRRFSQVLFSQDLFAQARGAGDTRHGSMSSRSTASRKVGMFPAWSLGKLSLRWEHARTSLWFLPSILVAGAIILSTCLLRLDRELGTGYARGWWLFGGHAEGARTVLSVIASSLITVVAVAFSMTMVALQQASAQFSPRVLRSFTSDRGNQLVLGTYIGTFTYALLVLRRVREPADDGAGFVPAISISTGMLLALVSLGLLVYFVHHVAEALQVSTVLAAVRRELDRELSRLYPSKLGVSAAASGEPAPVGSGRRAPESTSSPPAEVVLVSEHEGYVRRIDERPLVSTGELGATHLAIEVQVGDYVRAGDILLRAECRTEPQRELVATAAAAFQLDRDRSIREDPLFGIQQIVDIAVKALSPGVNDPTTAEQALDQLAGALTLLSSRTLPDPNRLLAGGLTCSFRTPTYEDFVSSAFAQVRRAARRDLHVSVYMLRLLHKMAGRATEPAYSAALARQRAELLAGFDRSNLTPAELTSLDDDEAEVS